MYDEYFLSQCKPEKKLSTRYKPMRIHTRRTPCSFRTSCFALCPGVCVILVARGATLPFPRAADPTASARACPTFPSAGSTFGTFYDGRRWASVSSQRHWAWRKLRVCVCRLATLPALSLQFLHSLRHFNSVTPAHVARHLLLYVTSSEPQTGFQTFGQSHTS